MTTRRELFAAALPLAFAARLKAAPGLRVTGLEVVAVRATQRTVWLFVRLGTNQGLTGLGEASDAFGFSNTSKQDALRLEAELKKFFTLAENRPPFDIERYRQAGQPTAAQGGPISATAFSAIEHALWDLSGQALGVPVCQLFGGKVRESLPVYANINRTTNPRTPEGFAATAKRAAAEGFRSIKAAPWDGFPRKGTAAETARAAELGIACVAAMREAVGPEVDILVDCHSNFTVPMAIDVAQRLEPYRLGWYEEPIPPQRTAETLEIRKAIRQQMAGGEFLFGTKGFAPLCREQAVHVIMPDVKHCGGILELSRIAALADAAGVEVAPHNPTGPVSTAASVQVCAGMKNFRILELQWGEAAWRCGLVEPEERFVHGSIAVPSRPGLGIRLNDKLAQAHPL